MTENYSANHEQHRGDGHITAAAASLACNTMTSLEASRVESPPEIIVTEEVPLREQAALALENMRTTLCSSGSKTVSKIPTRFGPAAVTIRSIQRAYETVKPDHRLPANAGEKLLSNVIRFQGDSEGLPERLTSSFLSELFAQYASDAYRFQKHKVPRPFNMALYHSGGILHTLDARYQDSPLVQPTDIVRVFSGSARNPAEGIDKMLEQVAELQTTIEPRIRAEYDCPGALSASFMKHLHYQGSVETKLRTVIETISALRQKYPRAKESTIDAWVTEATLRNNRRDDIALLLSEIPLIHIGETELTEAEERLNKLRLMRYEESEDEGVRSSRTDDPIVQRLARTIDASWHETFEGIDVLGIAAHLVYRAREFNSKLRPDQKAEYMLSDEKSLYALARALAQDIAVLKRQGPPSHAERLARFWGPGVYDVFRAKHAETPHMTPELVTTFVSLYPLNPDAAIKRHMQRADKLIERFGAGMTPTRIRRFTATSNGQDRLGRYLAFEGEGKALMLEHSLLVPSDIEFIFSKSDNPRLELQQFITRVENLFEQFAGKPRFPLAVIKRLARTVDSETAVSDHHKRIDDLLALYPNHPYIPLKFAALWSVSNPQSYRDAAVDHLKRVRYIKDSLRDQDIELDHIELGFMAFISTDPKDRLDKFFEIRKTLELERLDSDNEWTEQWMVDQAAAMSTNMSYARIKLRVLQKMKRSGVFDKRFDEPIGEGHSLHETLADTALHADPQQALDEKESRLERRQQVDQYLGGLNPMERMAVEAVFGFIADYDKEMLEVSLKTDDLETHVMRMIVPRLRR